MAKPGTAQTTARSSTHRTVARRDGRNITFYPLRVRATNENRGPEQNSLRRGGCRSVQLKVKCHGRNNFDLLTVNRSRFCPPLLHHGDGGIGERRVAFKKFLHLDAAVFLHAYLEFHDPLQASALRERRIRGLWKIDEALLEIVRILGDASPEGDFQIPEPAFEPVRLGFGGSRRFGQGRGCWPYFEGKRRLREPNFRQSLVEAVPRLADERCVKSNLRIQELQTNFPRRSPQFERGAATIQNSHGMQGAGTIDGRLYRQVQGGICFDVALAPVCHGGVEGRGEIPRQKHEDVAIPGSKRRCAREPHVSTSGRRVWINPGRNRSAGSGRLQGPGDASQTDAAAARFQFHRTGNVHDANPAPACLGMHRAAHFAEIDLPATGTYADEIPSMSDGDIAAGGFQFRAPSDLTGADVAASGAQRSVSRNVAHVDVSAPGEGREVTRDIENLDVAAFRLQFGSGTPQRSVAESRTSDAPRLNISALSVKGGDSTNVPCRDVARLGVHFDAVAARHGDLKLHPELGISRARGLRRKHAGDFHSRGNRLRLERVGIKELLCGGAAGICFDAHGVAHDRRGAGFEWNDVYGPKIRRQPQRETIFGTHHAAANNGGMLRTRLKRLGTLGGRWLFGFGRKGRRRERC